jgi:lipopolysaccharide/colanic/teichoic acid biosynthesis glycosyltransferase
VRAHFIDEIFVCVPNDRTLIMKIAKYTQGTSLRLRVIPDLYENAVIGAPMEYVGQFPTMTLHKAFIPTLQLIFKRIVDITVSGALIILLSPILLMVAMLVGSSSKGPLFYRSMRLGKKGETFVCYKFRTMVANAEALKASLAHLNERDGVLFKIARDPRITPVGRFLRKYSLDELPQLFNVLNGNMSLVGPRPPVRMNTSSMRWPICGGWM